MDLTLSPGSESRLLSKIGQKLYMRPEHADVYFNFGSGERLPAHRLLLSNGSDVFGTMFHGSLKEESDIKIVDASPEAFTEFLRFFYFDEVVLSVDNVAEVMYLGEKYDVNGCLAVCLKVIASNITADNAVDALSLAIMYDQTEMLNSCDLEIRLNSTKALQPVCRGECDRQVLKHILHLDGLWCSATDVFEVCMSWVKAISKQDVLTRDIVKTHLGELFYAIGFRSMTMAEFVRLIPSYGHLFSGEEYREILHVLSGREIESHLFKECSSLPFWNDEHVVVCDRLEKVSRRLLIPIGDTQVTKFSTNKSLLLGYFSLCGPVFHTEKLRRDKVKSHATIRANSEETISDFSFDYDSDSDGQFVYLRTPILIKPRIRYEIRLSFPTDEHFTFCPQLKSTVYVYNEIEVEFFDDRIEHGKKCGIIVALGFNSLKKKTKKRNP